MDENNLPLYSSSLNVTPAEISRVKEIEKQHEILLRQSEEMTIADISRVTDYLKSLAEAGAVIRNPDYRSQLRALIRYWLSFVADKTGILPVVQLQPYISAEPEGLNSEKLFDDEITVKQKGEKIDEDGLESSIPPYLISRTEAIKTPHDYKEILISIRNLLLYELDLRKVTRSDIDVLETLLRKIITGVENLRQMSSGMKVFESATLIQERLASAINSLYLASDLLEEGKTAEDRIWLYQTFQDCQQLLLDAIDQFPIGET